VTLTFSSLKARFSGEGRKSFITRYSPIGSLMDLIFFFIYLPSFPPIPCPEYAYHAASIGETNRNNAPAHLAKTVISLFSPAMAEVFGNHTPGIGKGILGYFEWEAML